MTILEDVDFIIKHTLQESLPQKAVQKALQNFDVPKGKIVLVAIGKAAWEMASAAYDSLEKHISSGIVITKYGHSKGPIGSLLVKEAGHPIPDFNSYSSTEQACRLVNKLTANDVVLFLVSGGGSALFETPTIPESELQDITRQLLACGADIVEINTIRKRLSAVKGGKFAQLCSPAKVFTIILSDVLGDPIHMIASGPAYPDASTTVQAREIVEKYKLNLSTVSIKQLEQETPKTLDNVETYITGSVRELCASAERACQKLGYRTIVLTDRLCCEAREAGKFLASIAHYHNDTKESLAFIAGGETIVRVTGSGLGGRNQEIVLAAAQGVMELNNCAIFSIGSDGTDGPTNAAGALCTGESAKRLNALGINIFEALKNNDSYNALKRINALIVTGPTGTNVNDLTCLLIKR